MVPTAPCFTPSCVSHQFSPDLGWGGQSLGLEQYHWVFDQWNQVELGA